MMKGLDTYGRSLKIPSVMHNKKTYYPSFSFLLSILYFALFSFFFPEQTILSLDPLLLIILPRLLQLVSKQLLRIHPNLGRLPLWQLQERRQKVGRELFRSFPRKKGGEVVDGDDGASLADALGVDLDGGGGEGGVDGVDGDGVVGVGRAARRGAVSSGYIYIYIFTQERREKKRDVLARNINDNAQSTIGPSLGDEFRSDKLGNWLGEVDAVDENVDVEDLGKGAALGRLGHIPLDDIFSVYQREEGA